MYSSVLTPSMTPPVTHPMSLKWPMPPSLYVLAPCDLKLHFPHVLLYLEHAKHNLPRFLQGAVPSDVSFRFSVEAYPGHCVYNSNLPLQHPHPPPQLHFHPLQLTHLTSYKLISSMNKHILF